MRIHGKYIVLGILLLAVVMATGNMAFQIWATHRTLDHWGGEAWQQIASAGRVEVLKLRVDGGDASAETIQTSRRRLFVVRKIEASHAQGLLHARRALLRDTLFDWHDPPIEKRKSWRYAMRFGEEGELVTLLLDETCLWVAAADDEDHPLRIRPIEDGTSPLRPFIEEQFTKKKANSPGGG